VSPSGQSEPLKISALVRDEYEFEALRTFQTDLASIGVALTITRAPTEKSFRHYAGTRRFSLISSRATMLNNEGWPDIQKLRTQRTLLKSACMRKHLQLMTALNPSDEAYRNTAESLARAHQAMGLNIFLGEARTVEFAIAPSLDVPRGLSLSRMHMYGFSK